MKIALLGYGKMGREVEKVALQRNHEVILKIDSDGDDAFDDLAKADVAIEFSMPSGAPRNILRCFDVNIPIVVGTTGWHGRLDELSKICAAKDQALFHASNFSIGVNIFFEINRKLAAIMNDHISYDVSIEETHHKHKLDSPSGTAIRAANEIIRYIERKNKWVNKTDKDFADKNLSNKSELKIKPIRKGEITGTHIVKYLSDIDTIEIKHTANSREGFAIGAVLAAEWLIGKKGVFTMEDMLAL